MTRSFASVFVNEAQKNTVDDSNTENLHVFLNVDNVFDEEYETFGVFGEAHANSRASCAATVLRFWHIAPVIDCFIRLPRAAIAHTWRYAHARLPLEALVQTLEGRIRKN